MINQHRIGPTQVRVLLVSAMVSSAVGLVLELLLVTQASYLVGDATLATGVVVGTFLAAMGLGAWLTQFLAIIGEEQSDLLQSLIWVELSLCPLCLIGPLGLFVLFSVDGPVWLAIVVLTIFVGVLGGMELPLITRVLETEQNLRQALAQVLALDYLGSLIGALAFPLLLLPWLGLLPTAALLSVIPVLCSLCLSLTFPHLRRWRRATGLLLPLIAFVGVLIAPLGDRIEDSFYMDPVISRFQSRFQRIVLTRRRGDLRLYLDGDLQFSSIDEYRYHEGLVHPAMAAHASPKRVLLLGAGDGLALREVLRWPEVKRVDLIELDPAMLRLAMHQPLLRQLNGDAFKDSRVSIHTGDAFALIRAMKQTFDVVIADFPDPDTIPIARLYSVGFYASLLQRIAPGGTLVTQASSPFLAPKVLASIEASLQQHALSTRAYTFTIPSFGPWGFVLAHRRGENHDFRPLPFSTRWLDEHQLQRIFEVPRDYRPDPSTQVLPNRLTRPVLIDYQRTTLGF